jgi:hypothetical protein
MQTVSFEHARQDDFKKWFIIHAFTKLPKEAQDRYMKDYKGSVTLDFKINGEEVDALEIIDEMERQYDDMTKKAARELIEEKLGDAYDAIEKMKRAMFDKLGIESEEW